MKPLWFISVFGTDNCWESVQEFFKSHAAAEAYARWFLRKKLYRISNNLVKKDIKMPKSYGSKTPTRMAGDLVIAEWNSEVSTI